LPGANLALFAILAVILLPIMNWAGTHSWQFGYVTFDEIDASGAFGFNTVFRVLTPSIYIGLVALVAYLFDRPSLVKGSWSIALMYWLVLLVVIAALGRARLIHAWLFGLRTAASVGLAYYLYEYSFKVGLKAFKPTAESVLIQLWALVAIWAYSALQAVPRGTLTDRTSPVITERYLRYSQRFADVLSPSFRRTGALHHTLFTFMLIEDLNRPSWLRGIERGLARLHLAKTTGIMQVASLTPLSDAQSVRDAEPIVTRLLETYRTRYLEEVMGSPDETAPMPQHFKRLARALRRFLGTDMCDEDVDRVTDTDEIDLATARYYIEDMYADYRGAPHPGTSRVLEVVIKAADSNHADSDGEQ